MHRLDSKEVEMKFDVRPIGWVRKTQTKTRIVLYKKYQAGLEGIERRSEIWVLWWFHRNDNPRMRSTLKVHPRGNPANPLKGVFATRAPLRPNLIALSRCKIVSVRNNIVEIDSIDAYPNTPVLDLKP
jgi:tRNA-Thr(GGU) m(6)t(6)A37 methyltransferase TsaA